MSATDGTESGGAGEPPDAKAEEEERYRLKTIALQECYDSVALQSVRLRERIYQVKKQCRRLEVMKRVALNMLHQNTGTYDIPPLEIVDEDPLPSFLESLHKQQLLTTEPPRKKSKRPSRSKTDGKLTPEEEERAKQKICSIIDSVYSETARRMGDASKRPVRNTSVLTPTSTADTSRRVSDVVAFNTFRNLNEEGNHTASRNQPDAGRSTDGQASSETASTQFNGHAEVGHNGEEQEESSITSYSAASSDDSSVVGYEPMLKQKQTSVYDGVGQPSHATYHNISEVYDARLTYSTNAEQVKELNYEANLADPAYDVSLDAIQPMNYPIDGSDRNQHRSEQSMNYGALQEGNGNAIVYDNSANYTNLATSSATQSYSENMNPGHVLDYARGGNPAQPVQYVPDAPSESRDHTSHPNTPSNYEDNATSPSGQANGVPKITAPGEDAGELTTKPAKKITSSTTDPPKQDAAKPSNNGLPLPNFIPYRMIAVENPKPVEVVTIDSGDETSSPKQLPKRRRKYKYVVESVLDNVPYTFRQAESDDDETTDKHSTTINTSIRTTN